MMDQYAVPGVYQLVLKGYSEYFEQDYPFELTLNEYVCELEYLQAPLVSKQTIYESDGKASFILAPFRQVPFCNFTAITTVEIIESKSKLPIEGVSFDQE